MYVKTKWEDRLVEFPNKYKDQNDKEYIFTQVPGQVTKEGTPVMAEKLNNIENGIYNNQLFCYQLTLLSTNWTLNTTTNLYEYNVIDENITNDIYVIVDLDIVNSQKLEGTSQVNSYDGGYIISTTELPTQDITASVRYELAVSLDTTENNDVLDNTEENTETGGSENAGEN